MKLIGFLCLLLSTNGFQPTFFTLSEVGNQFQAANPVEILSMLSNIPTITLCATFCYQNALCRTFDFDSNSHYCRLFEGSINRGTLVPTVSTTMVGWINIEPSMFNFYNASMDQCFDNRFLYSDILLIRCLCPLHTFWNGTMCLNQGFDGDVCVNNISCRNDLDISCIGSICVGPTSSLETTTRETTIRPSTQVTSYAHTSAIETSVSLTWPTTLTRTTSTTTTTTTTTAATCTTLVSFDDIPNESGVSGTIPNGYKNLNWTNAQYINATSMPSNSGFRYGVRSPPFVMYNPTSDNVTITTAIGTRFSFDSLRLISAWRDSLNITVKTIRAGSATSIGVFIANTTTRIAVSCSFCTNIDTITIAAQGGTPVIGLIQNGTQFIADDLCISFGQ